VSTMRRRIEDRVLLIKQHEPALQPDRVTMQT
jgi:hypothetical protein